MSPGPSISMTKELFFKGNIRPFIPVARAIHVHTYSILKQVQCMLAHAMGSNGLVVYSSPFGLPLLWLCRHMSEVQVVRCIFQSVYGPTHNFTVCTNRTDHQCLAPLKENTNEMNFSV